MELIMLMRQVYMYMHVLTYILNIHRLPWCSHSTCTGLSTWMHCLDKLDGCLATLVPRPSCPPWPRQSLGHVSPQAQLSSIATLVPRPSCPPWPRQSLGPVVLHSHVSPQAQLSSMATLVPRPSCPPCKRLHTERTQLICIILCNGVEVVMVFSFRERGTFANYVFPFTSTQWHFNLTLYFARYLVLRVLAGYRVGC